MRNRLAATGDIDGVQVGRVRLAAGLGDELDRVFDLAIGAGGDHHTGAGSREAKGKRATDAATTTGNERPSSRQRETRQSGGLVSHRVAPAPQRGR